MDWKADGTHCRSGEQKVAPRNKVQERPGWQHQCGSNHFALLEKQRRIVSVDPHDQHIVNGRM